MELIESGPWQVQLRGDELAGIRHSGTPVLRAIRAVIRDHDWRTLAPKVISRSGSRQSGLTQLRLEIDYTGFGSQYHASVALELRADSLHVSFDGEASKDFHSNRIGLVLLHHLDDAGREFTVVAPGGELSSVVLPAQISPHQPVKDMSAMTWQRNNSTFRVAFEGDVFEMEDQRNWTDASFKTYSTPLSRPFPVLVPAGEKLHQSVLLTANSSEQPAADGPASPVPSIKIGLEAIGRVPALGTSSGYEIPVGSAAGFRAVPGMAPLIVEIPGHEPEVAQGVLASVTEHATALGVGLDVRITVRSEADIAGALDLMSLDRVRRVGVFGLKSHVTDPGLWTELKREAQRRGFEGSLMAGTTAHFAELNRAGGSIPTDADSYTYSLTPQMHATEVTHIVESIPVQRLTAVNARRIMGSKPFHVGPVTLRPRFNAVATSGSREWGRATDVQPDPLQQDNFAAAWLLGSVAALTVPGVESVSFFELAGPRGLIQSDGEPTPALELFVRLAALRGAPVLGYEGNVPGVSVYPVQVEEGVLLAAANMTADAVPLVVECGNGTKTEIELAPWSAAEKLLEYSTATK